MALLDGHSGETEKYERRQRGRRYRISAAVAFAWQSPAGELRQANGISRDISGHGISVISNSIPIPGSPIEVTVNLPVPWARTALLRGRGVVLRLLPEAGVPWGFAATIVFDEEVEDEEVIRGEAEETEGPDSFLTMAARRLISPHEEDDIASAEWPAFGKFEPWRHKGGQA